MAINLSAYRAAQTAVPKPVAPIDLTEDTLLESLASNSLGAISAAGNFLDVPGSMVRDVLGLATGRENSNPFDQLLTPFSDENRTSGRDLLTHWGLTAPNKETGMTGWLDDPMEGVRDVAGFLAETATDPLNMLNKPVKGLGTIVNGKRIGRGAIDNVLDPFRLTELGQKIGARDRVFGPVAKVWNKQFRPERTRVLNMAKTTFGEGAEDAVVMMDAHAGQWAKATGRKRDEWFKKIAEIREGDVSEVQGRKPETDVLNQMPTEFNPANVSSETSGQAQLMAMAKEAQGSHVDAMFAKYPNLATRASGNTKLNAWLRGAPGSNLSSWGAKDADHLSALQDAAASAPPLPKDLLGIRQVTSGDVTEAVQKLNVGDIGEVSAPTGVSVDPNYAASQRGVAGGQFSYVTFEMPKGTKGFWFNASDKSHIKAEHEITLPVGTQYKVLEKTVDEAGRANIKVRIIPQTDLPKIDFNNIKAGDSFGRREVLEARDVDMKNVFEVEKELKAKHGATNVQRFGKKLVALSDSRPEQRLFQAPRQSVLDEAFDEANAKSRLPGYVSLQDLRNTKAMQALSREQQDQLIREMRQKGMYNLSTAEGRVKATPEEAASYLRDPLPKDAPPLSREPVYSGISRNNKNWKPETLQQKGWDPRGMVEFARDGKATIVAFKSADISTLVHETAHIFRRSLGELSPALLQRAERELGVVGGDWRNNVRAEEMFAGMFEDYMMKGEAPKGALRQVFERFEEWLTDIYKSLSLNKPEAVSAEMKEVFDAMLGGRKAGRVNVALGARVFGHLDDPQNPFHKLATATGSLLDGARCRARQAFDPSVHNTATATGQYLMENFYDPIMRGRTDAAGNFIAPARSDQFLEAIIDTSAKMKEMGFSTLAKDGIKISSKGDDPLSKLRGYLENAAGYEDAVPENVAEAIDNLMGAYARIRNEYINAGGSAKTLWDQATNIKHVPRKQTVRQKVTMSANRGNLGSLADKTSSLIPSKYADELGRDIVLKGSTKGSVGINSVFDDEVNGWTKQMHSIVGAANAMPDGFERYVGSKTFIDAGIADELGMTATEFRQAFAETAEKIGVKTSLPAPDGSTVDVFTSLLPQDAIRTIEAMADRLVKGDISVPGMLKQQHAFGKVSYTDAGEGSKFTFGWDKENRMPVPTEGKIERVTPEEFTSAMQAENPAILKDVEDVVASGLDLFKYTYNDDGVDVTSYLMPKTYHSGARKLKDAKRILDDPDRRLLQPEEVATEHAADQIRRNHSDHLIDEMPKVIEKPDGTRLSGFRDTTTGRIVEVPTTRLDDPWVQEQIESGRYVMEGSRYEALAADIARHPELSQIPMFGNDPLVDLMTDVNRLTHTTAMLNTITELAAMYANRIDDPLRASVGDILSGQRLEKVVQGRLGGIDRTVLYKNIWERSQKLGTIPRNMEFDEKLLNSVVIPDDVLSDIVQAFDVMKQPDEVNAFLKAYEAGTTIFKAGVLTNPARYVRDFVSGGVMNLTKGIVHPFTAAKSYSLARDLARGVEVDLTGIPAIVEMGKKQGVTDNAGLNRIFKSWYAARKGAGYSHLQSGDYDPMDLVNSGRMDEYMDLAPGGNVPNTQSIKQEAITGIKAAFADKGRFNPLAIGGNRKLDGTKRTKSEFFISKIGEGVGQYFDNTNRIAAVIDQARRGIDPEEAFRHMTEAQVDYNRRNYTRLENRYLKRIFPFYSFTSRALPMVVKELLERPGGPLAKTIRAHRIAQGNQFMPPDLKDTAIPLGTEEDGTSSYLSGLGLMHEDPIGILSSAMRGDTQDLASDLLGRVNPLIKAPIEWATGTSLFMKGPMGNKRLSELDPTIGRTLANIGLTDIPEGGRPDPFISPFVEFAAANSPLSKALQMARTATDPRKSVGKKMSNLFSGVKFSDVSPEQMDRTILELLSAKQIKMGARPFTTVVGISKAAETARAAGDEKTAQEIEAAQALAKIYRKRTSDAADKRAQGQQQDKQYATEQVRTLKSLFAR